LRRAKTIGAQLIAEKRAEWDQLLSTAKSPGAGPQVLTTELVEHICARRLYHWMRVDDLGRFEGQGHDDQSHATLTQLCQVTDKSMRSVLARGRSAPEWARTMDVLDFWCEQMDKPVSRTDPLYPKLVRQFAEVELEATGRVLRRNQGEAAATPEAPNPVGACLSAMTEVYRDYKKQHAGGKHTGTSVHVWSKLIDDLGDLPLSSIKASDLFEFLEVRMRAPVKPWSMKHAHGLVKRTLREVFALARTRGLLDGANPVDDLDILPTLTTKEEKAGANRVTRSRTTSSRPCSPRSGIGRTRHVGRARWRPTWVRDIGCRSFACSMAAACARCSNSSPQTSQPMGTCLSSTSAKRWRENRRPCLPLASPAA
jgi:hypothetical protein